MRWEHINLDGSREVRDAAADLVPAEVTNSQARRALRRAGLFDAVDAAVKAAGGEMLDAWEYANVFYRNSSFVVGMAQALSLSDAQVDDLFRVAAGID